MPYVLRCTCGSKISVLPSQAGSRIECPQCQAKLEIPTIRRLSSLELEEESSVAENRSARAASRWTPLRRAMAAVCFAVALLGLGRAGWYGIFRLSNPTSYTESEMLREAELRSQELSPVEAWDLWRYLQETGISRKTPPQALVIQRALEQRDAQMMRWAIVGGLGLLGLFACILWSSRPPSR